MKKIKFTLYLFSFALIFIVSGYSHSEIYSPIDSGDYLFKKDIPIFLGLDNTLARLENSGKDHKIWALNLSGGSARALAHIGVLKRLEEEGLRPDVIITDSMGSIVGLTYASGMRVEDIEEIINSITLSHYFDLVFPSRGGIISVRRFRALIKTIFGDLDISETPIPVFVVTEDIKTKRQVILSKGYFNDVLAASFALPVYFNPVDFCDYRLIDGGISNLVPLKPFHPFLPDIVVSSTFYNVELNLKNPVTILNVSMDISKTRKAVKQIKEYSPFLIRCDVEKISYMAFDSSEEIIKKGYESCNDEMDDLLKYLSERDIYPSTAPVEPFEIAETYRKRWNDVKNKLDYIDLPTDGTDFSSSIGFLNWKTYGSMHNLNENLFIEEANWFRFNNTGFEAGIFSDIEGNPGIKLSLNYGSGNCIFMETSVLSSMSLDSESVSLDNLYLFGRIYSVFSPDRFIIRPSVIMESDTDRTRISPGITWNFSFPYFNNFENISVEQSAGTFHSFNDTGLTGSGIRTENVVSIPLSRLITFNTRQMLKVSIGPGKENAGLSYSDFFRSSSTTIFSDTENFYSSYALFNNSINWRAGAFLPTIAEMFILDKTDLFIFTDIFTNGILPGQSGQHVEISTGAGVNINASLIGLQPWILTVLGGYDFSENSFFFSFNLD